MRALGTDLRCWRARCPRGGRRPTRDLAKGGQEPPSAYIGDDASIEAGHELYLNVCSGCHGITAEGGRGPNLITGRNARRASNGRGLQHHQERHRGQRHAPLAGCDDPKVWQIAAYGAQFERAGLSPAHEGRPGRRQGDLLR